MAMHDVPVTAPLGLSATEAHASRPPARADGRIAVTLAGEAILLLPERALYWPRQRALFVADVHLGKAARRRPIWAASPR